MVFFLRVKYVFPILAEDEPRCDVRTLESGSRSRELQLLSPSLDLSPSHPSPRPYPTLTQVPLSPTFLIPLVPHRHLIHSLTQRSLNP
ncbi:hypothetical protein E2C01_071406 [Portunus trituberculatus]|uniref:Uncharacterized protein n=1 Tax=Portunus trituberculatus TaxID=210409 RepID=A0A5B7I511_PORTR|nr:hypothetical protein [Portunus trituberculatus]